MTSHQHAASPTVPGAAILSGLGLPSRPELPASVDRFPDGGAWRIEIPSVEGPGPLAAVVKESVELAVPIHRVSQGSGVMMLSDSEIVDMVETCRDADIELCLFLGPRGTWDIGAGVRSSSGGTGPRARGYAQLAHCLADAERAANLGVRNVLIADEGVLWAVHQLRQRGDLPADLRTKVSVLTASVNPISFQLLGQLGADSINLPSDLTLAQVSELRSASPVAIDFYVEAPDDLGGFVRLPDAAELVRVGAPIYLKFGIRNAPVLYPSGRHIENLATDMARERVRRARLVVSQLEELGAAVPDRSPLPACELPGPARFAPVAAARALGAERAF